LLRGGPSRSRRRAARRDASRSRSRSRRRSWRPAQKVLALYDRTRPRRTEMLAIEDDRRLDAYELHARGKIAIAEGRTAQGISELERSLDLWTRLSYRLRAALTADDLRTAPVSGATRRSRSTRCATPPTRGSACRSSGAASPTIRSDSSRKRNGGSLTECAKGRKHARSPRSSGRSFNTDQQPHARGLCGVRRAQSAPRSSRSARSSAFCDDLETRRGEARRCPKRRREAHPAAPFRLAGVRIPVGPEPCNVPPEPPP